MTFEVITTAFDEYLVQTIVATLVCFLLFALPVMRIFKKPVIAFIAGVIIFFVPNVLYDAEIFGLQICIAIMALGLSMILFSICLFCISMDLKKDEKKILSNKELADLVEKLSMKEREEYYNELIKDYGPSRKDKELLENLPEIIRKDKTFTSANAAKALYYYR